jgi:hypothetical protein
MRRHPIDLIHIDVIIATISEDGSNLASAAPNEAAFDLCYLSPASKVRDARGWLIGVTDRRARKLRTCAARICEAYTFEAQ